MLMYGRGQHNIVKQLSSNEKKREKKKKCPSGGPRFLQGEEREEPPALIQVWQSQGSTPERQALEKGHKEK